MLNVKKTHPNRLDITLSAKLDTQTMQRGLDELLVQSEGIEHGKMLYEVIDFHLPSLGAMGVEFSRLPALFGLIKRFDRAAVLADQAWVQRVSELEGALFPGLEIKAFDRDQRAAAEAWLAYDPPINAA